MTTKEIRNEAIEAAKHAMDTHGVPHTGCDDDLTFEECGSVYCTLARYILSLHDETPVTEEEIWTELQSGSIIQPDRDDIRRIRIPCDITTRGQLARVKDLVGV